MTSTTAQAMHRVLALVALTAALLFAVFAVRWVNERRAEDNAWAAVVAYGRAMADRTNARITEQTKPCDASDLFGTVDARFRTHSANEATEMVEQLRQTLEADGWDIQPLPPSSEDYRTGDFEGTKTIHGRQATVFTYDPDDPTERYYAIGLEGTHCILGG